MDVLVSWLPPLAAGALVYWYLEIRTGPSYPVGRRRMTLRERSYRVVGGVVIVVVGGWFAWSLILGQYANLYHDITGHCPSGQVYYRDTTRNQAGDDSGCYAIGTEP